MKAPLSPIVVVLLAVLLSTGAVTYWFMGVSAGFITRVTAQRAVQAEAARPEKPWDFWTPEMEGVAKELADERATIARREAELSTWETRLVNERKELDALRYQVEKLRSEIDSRLVQVQAQELRNLKTLATTYSRLSPSAAVAIFGQMDDLLVAKLLSLMKPDVSTAILEEFSRDPGPDGANLKRAAELTQRLRLLLPVAGATR